MEGYQAFNQRSPHPISSVCRSAPQPAQDELQRKMMEQATAQKEKQKKRKQEALAKANEFTSVVDVNIKGARKNIVLCGVTTLLPGLHHHKYQRGVAPWLPSLSKHTQKSVAESPAISLFYLLQLLQHFATLNIPPLLIQTFLCKFLMHELVLCNSCIG
eukprot:Phypoly_transcript_14085.p1 GENE.Phypoly_transcript_14085~~Phypoly_transcript_14085.p1  ORF type:complete len:159 (+),score=23.16 Phypoly_transcript_14085:529-1005(+)